MNDREYKEFNSKSWADFGKALLKTRGSDKQIEFLNVCKSRQQFLDYIANGLPIDTDVIGNFDVHFSYTFSEMEYMHPEQEAQQAIWDAFNPIPYEIKFSCGFWAFVIVNAIKCNQLHPAYFAASPNNQSLTGDVVIDKVILSGKNDAIDRLVRLVLRAMCHPAPRGGRIVFYDFPLGKSYWRWHWANERAKHIGLTFEQVLKLLSSSYYQGLTEKRYSNKSFISQPQLFDGLLLYLHSLTPEQGMTTDEFKRLINKMSYLSIWKGLEAQSPDVNRLEIAKLASTGAY